MKDLSKEFVELIKKHQNSEKMRINYRNALTQCGNVEHKAITVAEFDDAFSITTFRYVQDTFDNHIPTGAKGYELSPLVEYKMHLDKNDVLLLKDLLSQI